MPKAIEDKLKKQATKLVKAGKLKGTAKGESSTEKKNAYVYGTLNKLKKNYGV